MSQLHSFTPLLALLALCGSHPQRAEAQVVDQSDQDARIFRGLSHYIVANHDFHFTPGDAVATHAMAGRPQGSFLAVVPSFVQAPDGRMLCFMNVSERPHKFPRHHFGGSEQTMAWWPADRLVALEAESCGEFTTPPMKLAGSELRLNMAASRAGGIRIEVRDEKFLPIAGRTFAESDVLTGDDVWIRATWRRRGAR